MRYHLYWAGSDIDGAVSGFYWAVVETLPVPPGEGLGIPGLPGPKPQDYRYTARTDSVFIFNASEQVSEREHTFYIYAIDNKGKPDATPARFMFRSYDRFPPLAVIDSAYAEGTVYLLTGGGSVTPVVRTYTITDSFDVQRPFPRDTVPASARLEFRWHGEPTVPSTVVTGFRYKLDESEFNVVDSTVRRASYNTGIGGDVVSTGKKVFTLRAVGQSGWRGEATRYFYMNFAPDTWFSGPDVNDALQGWQSFTDGNGKRYYYRDVAGRWENFTGIPGTMLSSDSVNVLPASRPERRTFFEFYQNRIWAHAEGDTVHLNSWVMIPGGGYDADSPYLVNVGFDPDRPVGVVTTPDPNPNGSPVGFRANTLVRKPPPGGTLRPTESNTFPVFNLTDSYHAPRVNYLVGLATTGQAFAYLAAEDGNKTVDRRIDKAGGPENIVDAVPVVGGPGGTDEQRAIRSKVLTFYVNHAPRVDIGAANFYPKPGTVLDSSSQPFVIVCHDIDPIDESKTVPGVGGPQQNTLPVLVRTVDLIQDQGDTLITQRVCENLESQNFNFIPSSSFEDGPLTVRVQLSDGRPDRSPRYGYRTVTVDIPVTYTTARPAGAVRGSNHSEQQSTQRPGSPPEVHGRP